MSRDTPALVRTRTVLFIIGISLEDMHHLDLDQFRAKRNGELQAHKSKRPPRHKAGEWFLKGRSLGSGCTGLRSCRAGPCMLPWPSGIWPAWKKAAGETHRGRVHTVGRVTRCRPPWAGSIELAGLVAVNRHAGRCPVVTILESEKGQ